MEAGRRAGVKTCGVLWGYGRREEMERWQPDYWLANPADLRVESADLRVEGR
jgi:phosphoglycolate phosphatase-like HAD superfamily hydrolase